MRLEGAASWWARSKFRPGGDVSACMFASKQVLTEAETVMCGGVVPLPAIRRHGHRHRRVWRRVAPLPAVRRHRHRRVVTSSGLPHSPLQKKRVGDAMHRLCVQQGQTWRATGTDLACNRDRLGVQQQEQAGHETNI
eukprot:364605-Chlamydomonas_euryale.AAC.7